ncbi:MAG TPA: hypothetical protein VMQ51_10635 [Candidatus Binatia bacterium]|jgi:hypothetical protein|nr:hypothetical protein [Candidatus Binatia bacterium]
MKVLFWGLVIVAALYLAYSGMMAAWSWIAVNNAVDEIVSKDDVTTIPSPELKAKVMRAAGEAGVPLTDKDVVVTHAGQGVNVEVLWTVPIVVVNGDAVFAVPLAVRRSSAKR